MNNAIQLNIFDAAIEAEKEMAHIMAVQSAQKAATKKGKHSPTTAMYLP